jgi:hypothetical protein
MKRDPSDDRRRLEAFFRDELRLATAEAPSFDDIAAYVEDRLDPEERAALEERMAADPALRQEVDDLRELRDQMRRSQPVATRRRPFALAGLAAAAAVAGVALWLRPSPERRPGEDRNRPSLSAAPIVTLRDGDARVALSREGAVSGLPSMGPGLRDAIAGALRGVLPAPQGLEPLQPRPLALLGGPGDATAFAPVAPLGTRVASDRPVFRWSPDAEARTYEVSVFDQDLQKRAGSGPITGTRWTPERPLPRGHTYLWQVSALTGHGRLTAPAPPAPEARFEVVDPAVLADVERRRAAAPGSRLVATVVLVQAGLLDDADAELQALAADNPGSPQVARLSDALRDLRRPR